MKSVDFLIVGGSAAGTTAAEVIRTLAPQATIMIVCDEDHEEYSRVLLPHYIRHKVNREQVFLKNPEWYQEEKIELVRGTKAMSLEPESHRVKVSNGEEYQYGKLLIAIGGYVNKFNVPGSDLGNILYMRTVEDADRIIELASKSKRAVVVGGGFIGLEFTSCFAMNGVRDVTVLVMEDYYWQGKLDQVSSKVLANTLGKNGIKILTNEEVDRFDPRIREDDKGTVGVVKTKSGKTFEVDVVGVGIGIKSDLSWLEGSGIEINRAIVTNEYLETNLPDVYAAGDCAEFKDVIFNRQHIMGNWANATSQGSAVGKTMAHSASLRLRDRSDSRSSGQAGQRTVFETASSYSINFFDGACTFIGVTDDKFADEVISRGSVGDGKMTRIFVKTIDGVMRVVGATIINNPAEVSPLSLAVKNRINIVSNKDKLSDQNFDLEGLIV